jgi:tetratricopeptide (TPR) repeat protein
MAVVLLAAWALLNIPPPPMPHGRFILAVAELGEAQPGPDGTVTVQPPPRTLWDDFRASLPANVPIPTRLPTLRLPTTAGGVRQLARQMLRRADEAAGPLPSPVRVQSVAAAAARAAGDLPDLGDQSDWVQPATPPAPMPTEGRGAMAWLLERFNARWRNDPLGELIADDIAFAPDGETARALAGGIHADAALWGVIRGAPDPALWMTVELISDLERMAQPGEVELRLTGLRQFNLGPLAPNRPELLLALVTGLAYYAARDFRGALNEWSTALIAARVDRDMAPPLDAASEAVVHFYRGNAYFLDVASLPPDKRKETLLIAEAAYLEALKADPTLAEAHHNLGLVYQAQGRLDRTAPELQAALELNPDLARARYNQGVLLLNLGQIARATELFESFVEMRPEDAEALRALGRVYRVAGQLDEAEVAFKAAIRQAPGYALAHADLAALYYERARPAQMSLAPLEAELERLVAAGRDTRAIEQRAAPLQQEHQQWLELARTELTRAVAERPNNAYDHYNMAVVLHDSGQVSAAAEEVQVAERLRPPYAEYGVRWAANGRLDHTTHQFIEATALRPASAETFINVGLDLQREGRIAEATDQFIRVLYLDPANPDANYRLGMVYMAQGEVDAAALHLQNAITAPHDPPWPPAEAVDALATIYRNRQDYDRALALLQAQLARDSHDARAHYNLGTIYRRQGKLDEAIAAFRAAIQYDPSLADAHYNLGVAYTASGRLDEARDEFQRIAKLNPEDPDTHVLVGVALKDARQFDAARAEFEHAIRLNPDHVEAHYNLGLVYQALGRHDAAMFEYRDVLRLDPNNTRVLTRLGMVYADTGRIDDAVSIFSRLVHEDANNAEAHYNLGVAYRARNDMNGVLREFREVVRLRPDDAEAFNTLGEALRTADQLEAAERAFRRAIDLRPDLAEAHYNLGRVLMAINRTAEGVDQLRIYEDLKDRERLAAMRRERAVVSD